MKDSIHREQNNSRLEVNTLAHLYPFVRTVQPRDRIKTTVHD